MSTSRILQTAVLALQLLLAVPAAAQLAPNSPYHPSGDTDFLNLYQATAATIVNPEILVVIDQSGSASRLMFHPLFPNNWQDETPPNTVSGSDDYTLLVKNTSWPSSGSLTSTLSVGFATDYSQSTFVSYVPASGHNYYIGGSRGTVTIGAYTYPYNTLIKPDGTEVTAADVIASGGTTNNSVAWLRCASHVRLRLTRIDSTTLTTPRDIDFPLFYKPLDSSATISTASGLMSGSTNLGGLTVSKANNPQATSTPVMFDTDLNTTNPALNATGAHTWVNVYGGRALTNAYAVRTRYIEWMFVGKDPNSPNSGAYYCIPNAIPSATTDKSIQRSIDPASLAYDGDSGTYTWSYITEDSTPADLSKGWYVTFANKLPNRTRMMAIKEAVIKSWLNYQTSIFFAWRLLYESGDTPSNTLSTSYDNNWNYITSASSLASIAALPPGGDTPLVDSFLNAYCQMTNPQAFQSMIGAKFYTAAQLECLHHFVIVLTDGAPTSIPSNSEGNCSFPYLQTAVPSGCSGYTAGNCPAYSGNAAVKAHAGYINDSGTSSYYWNTVTLAGVAAHGGDGSTTNSTWIRDPKTEGLTGSLSSLTSNSGWLPLWVTKRYASGGSSATTLAHAQPIQTMTVGVSLGVNFLKANGSAWNVSTDGAPTVATAVKPIRSDTSGSKFRLMAAALVGDPFTTTYDITTTVPFYNTPGTTTKASNAAYFFDGRDPSTLVNNLDDAIAQIIQLSGVSSTAAPVFPTVGAGLGSSVFIAKFQPPVTPGPLWTGDLVMFATKQVATGTALIDGTGTAITGDLNDASPMWSAANALTSRGWLNRRFYSRVPSSSTAWNPAISRIDLGTSGTDTSNAGYAAIATYLPGTNAATKLKNWQFIAGADMGSGTAPLGTRGDTIMGDIINSSPITLQYAALPSNIASYSSTLADAWAAHAPGSGTTDQTGTFRMIFVGTNQGVFHAFGEVEWVDNTTVPGTPIAHGVLDELWAFVPTELLPNLDQLQVSTNKHYYAVDGAPTVYFLDLPQTAVQATGNGVFDVGATNPERAVVVFGLGKGGRSYYAINVADPLNPTMQWSLCPNEQYNYPTSRVLGGSRTDIGNMGLATCIPTLARVATSREGTTNQVVDVVLLGGGFSDPLIEAALPATATTSVIASYPAVNTALGRSAVAINVYTGNILNTWNTGGTSGAGPVPAGVMPMAIDANSYLSARGYFTDYYGSLWALGGTSMAASPRTMFRVDTVSIDSWNLRQVYTQTVSLTGGAGNGLCTTLPSPFRMTYFPVTRTTDPKINPYAMGIAFETGDRNNPLDTYTYTRWAAPTQHRVNVVFDRQDINSVISASGLSDASSMVTDSTNSSYFLRNSYGYYINFASPSGGYVPKGITSPLVLDANLFYSVFTPSTATCSGGSGSTTTFQVCNVMVPVVNAGNASSATAINGCKSGAVLSWSGVASSLAGRNVVTGVQAGIDSGSGTTTDQSLMLKNLNTQSTDIYPKIRVWRIVR